MAPQNDEANLARIRDNQRRSRARRKEYQQELEQRVRAFEEQGVEASTEVQHAARRVADENKKLRSLLQQNGVSHATIEAYLKGTSTDSSAHVGGNVNSLEHLMVPRFPLQYTSPLMSGTLSATGSVGPSSPSGGDDTSAAASGYLSYDNSNTSPPIGSKTGSSNRGGGGSSSHSKSHGHSHSSHSHGHRDKGKKTSSSTSGAMTTTTTADYSGYLSPGYSLSTAFYGLDGTSAEDLQYGSGSGGAGTGAEPILFDYSVSPQYLGEGSGAGTGSVSGVSQPPVSAPYYGMMGGGSSGNTAGSFVRNCPACMSGMGCQIHGGFFDE
ncbi:hypothetical protein Sste5346_001584 [Sporothrix stenoceras]|uniref:BZIP domain-containing protein n=1 Tax=Sporothrix stenoceras TaxID=5173 RepID=A0ABR3ZQV2_9PEZI